MELAMQQEKAKQLRADIIKMLYLCQSGHPGGSLSLVEMLMAIYYNTAHVDPKNPKWEDRDRIVLSKGHGCPAQYAILAELGFCSCNLLFSISRASFFFFISRFSLRFTLFRFATCRAIPTATRRRALM